MMEKILKRLDRIIELLEKLLELGPKVERHSHFHSQPYREAPKEDPNWRRSGTCNCPLHEGDRGRLTGGWWCPLHGQQF